MILNVYEVLEKRLGIKYFYFKYIDGKINIILRRNDWRSIANYMDKQPHPQAVAFIAYGRIFRIEN